MGSFPIICLIIKYLYTQLLIGDNGLDNHTDNVLAMLLQTWASLRVIQGQLHRLTVHDFLQGTQSPGTIFNNHG